MAKKLAAYYGVFPTRDNSGMWPDVRFAARVLSKSPLFTVGVMALLTFGVAANTVIFSLVDALLLRPLPVRDPERLVRLVTVREPLGARSYFLHEEYEAWRQHVSGFEDLLAWAEHDMYVTAGERTERARVHFVTENFFSVLSAAPAHGRLLTPEDQEPAAGTASAVLSYPYWMRRFGGDEGVIGRTITLGRHQVVVAGVTAKGFNGLTIETSPDLRLPVGWLRTLEPNLYENQIVCEVAGRLRAGVEADAVRQEAEAVWRNGWRERNPTDPGLAGRFELQSAARGISRMRAQFSGVLWLLMAGGALLMLMVCANVAGLLMARSAGREGELAVRRAMGASRFRLARQLFCESLLLMAGGAAGGVALSFAALPFVTDTLPPVRDFAAVRLPLALGIALDWRVLGFSIAVSAATVLLFGLIPAMTAARRDLHPLLKAARAGGGWRGRQALVSAQVALCTILLAGAGLTVLTLERLDGIDAGFRREGVVTFSVDPNMANYTQEQSAGLQRRLLDGARELPGVESAALASRGLMRGTGLKMTVARAGETAGPDQFMNTSVNHVSREYFATMGIRWRAGRNFTGREIRETRPEPVVVNEAFARRFDAGGGVLGARFGAVVVNAGPAEPRFEVIGVVGDTKYRSFREPIHPIIYGPLFHQSFILHLRMRSGPESVIGPMNRLLAGIDPRLSYIEVTMLESEVKDSLWAERMAAFLAVSFRRRRRSSPRLDSMRWSRSR